MIDKQYKWHVLYVIRHHEKKINNWIFNQGIETFLPLRKSIRKWSDRIKEVAEPVFPSYVFVKVSSREYYSVLSNPYIIRYVCFGGQPAIISEEKINAMGKIFSNKVLYEVSSRKYNKGEKVIICKGPLNGIVGEVLLNGGTDKLVLKIDEIGYALVVNISNKYLIKAHCDCHVHSF